MRVTFWQDTLRAESAQEPRAPQPAPWPPPPPPHTQCAAPPVGTFILTGLPPSPSCAGPPAKFGRPTAFLWEDAGLSSCSLAMIKVRNKTANGDCRKDPRERSRSPIERAVAPTMSLHGGPLYASLPSLSMEQPLALTKNSLDAGRPAGLSPTLAPVERQQNRPSVITCASASARNCNLSHCPVAHSGCAAGPASYRRTPSSTCDPVVEEHFRRSLGKNYKEPEPAPNSVSITGSVDDHFAKALGDTWLQIKAAKDGASSSPESASRRGQPASPSAHMVSHGHSPSVVS
ncbi:transcription cofactor vestigial-like protein 4 isoform X8 [Ovis aries]|uniref:Vestigial like family member 4 n=2 Tax=Caprinae TaxID=9963 RepID=A0AC11CZA3_SHEEP|nr:transcription cofactor vestigial-like protein 4 isoform X8 [Ovis aries]